MLSGQEVVTSLLGIQHKGQALGLVDLNQSLKPCGAALSARLYLYMTLVCMV